MNEYFLDGFEKTAFIGGLFNRAKSFGKRMMSKRVPSSAPKAPSQVSRVQPQAQESIGNSAMQSGRFAKMQKQKNLAKAKAQKDQAMKDAIAKSRAKKDALTKQQDAQIMEKMRNPKPRQVAKNRTPSYEASVDKAISNARSDQAARSAKIKTEVTEKLKARKSQEAAVAKQKARAEARAEANRIKNQRPTPGKVKTPFIEENKRRARQQELSNLDAFNPGRM